MRSLLTLLAASLLAAATVTSHAEPSATPTLKSILLEQLKGTHNQGGMVRAREDRD